MNLSLTYGYAEAIPVNGEYQLAGTSYHNYASPFIRYNTEDVISDITENEGILRSFKISKGRSGEFVLDKNGKRMNLIRIGTQRAQGYLNTEPQRVFWNMEIRKKTSVYSVMDHFIKSSVSSVAEPLVNPVLNDEIFL